MSTDQSRSRFEPPPWEREAFERFQKEQEEIRKREEAAAALRAAREEAAPQETPGEPASQPAAPAGDAAPATESQVPAPLVSEARINAMLVQLRGEEPTAASVNKGLVNAVIGFMGLVGLTIITQGIRLFAATRAAGPTGTMLAATVSFMVFVVGIGFIGGAVLLFRKYHQ